MINVILQPAGGSEARIHYRDTIDQPVSIDRLRRHLSDSAMATLGLGPDVRGVPTWGVKPSQRRLWERIGPGDVVLFTGDGNVFASATILGKIHSAGLARDLWQVDREDGQTWEYVYFVDRPVRQAIGYAALNDAVGYAPNAVPLGFRILDEARSEAVLARFPQLVVAGATSPEIVEAEQAIARAAGKAKGGGQGFQLSPAARTAIEHHAMDRVQQYYEGLGWKVARVQVDRPYDLLCTKGDQKLHVEVKGTMSPGVKVVVTAGEVRHAQQGSVSIALAVVSRITLQSVSHGKTTATSGTLRVQHPWNIDPERLEPIGYFYRRLPMEMERAVDSELDVGSVRSHHVAPSP